MEGLGLLIGHLLGDYILQNDWMAKNKSNHFEPQRFDALSHWHRGLRACTVHCLLYTAVVWLCACWWLPWWGVVVCFAAHWPLDHWRLAYHWMTKVSGQSRFASGPLSPWSIVVVDNTFHLLTLWVIGMVALH